MPDYPSVTQVLKELGFINDQFFTVEGSENGTRRHKVVELYDLDDLESCDDVDLPYLQGWKQYREDTGIAILNIEKRRSNDTYRYTGKPDRVVSLNGKLMILDIKTGSPQPSTKYQIGGYLGLYTDIFAGQVVYLQDNGKYKLSEKYGRKEREAFFNIVTVYHLREDCIK